jgi:hypothetical protein
MDLYGNRKKKKKKLTFSLELRTIIHHRCRSSISSSVRERIYSLVKHASSFFSFS